MTLKDGELTVAADTQSRPQQMNNLIQAMLSVNDLFCLAQPTVYQFFTEDVTRWLDEKAVRFSPHVSFAGKSTFTHHYDFLIPKSKASPERLLKVMNSPSRDYTKQVAFSWIDTRGTRPMAAECFVLLNDAEGIPSGVLTSLKWDEGTKNGPDRSALLGHNFVYQETKPYGFYSSYFHQRISS